MTRILCIDDDVVAAHPLCRLLEHAGFHVESISNGQDAVERIVHNTPDLVLLDLLMPNLDGCLLLQMIRSYERLESLPVIVLTGDARSPLIEQVRKLNAVDVLIKGEASFNTIISVVRRHSPVKQIA